MDPFPLLKNAAPWTHFGFSSKRFVGFSPNWKFRWNKWISFVYKWSHVLETSGSGVMDPFPMMKNAAQWTHFGFSPKWLLEFSPNWNFRWNRWISIVYNWFYVLETSGFGVMDPFPLIPELKMDRFLILWIISESAWPILLIFCMKSGFNKRRKVTEPDFWKNILEFHIWRKTWSQTDSFRIFSKTALRIFSKL